MHAVLGTRLILPVLMALLASAGGCGLVTVEMTSSPPTAQTGDPVTFNITLTNQSPCPMDTTFAILFPFISQSELDAQFAEIPPDAPPEILEFVQELREFLDELCAGGQPTIPTPPIIPAVEPPTLAGLTTGCRRGDGVIECEFSLRLREQATPMSFALFRGRMQCEIVEQIARCRFEIPLPETAQTGGVTNAATALNCLTPEQLGLPSDVSLEGEVGAFCIVGTFPMLRGLEGNEIAAGQVTLPARGAGIMRNLIIVGSEDEDEAGVCKGGATPGAPCELNVSNCFGGMCLPGICVGGTNSGQGCNALGDCPMASDCVQCAAELPIGALPIDCTTTYVSPEGAPVASPWALAVLACALVITGTYWLRRRRAL